MAFWNWTRISEAKKEREEGGCGSLGSGVDLTFLIAVACTMGILCTLWILYRAYRLLFMTYCTAMSRAMLERVEGWEFNFRASTSLNPCALLHHTGKGQHLLLLTTPLLHITSL